LNIHAYFPASASQILVQKVKLNPDYTDLKRAHRDSITEVVKTAKQKYGREVVRSSVMQVKMLL